MLNDILQAIHAAAYSLGSELVLIILGFAAYKFSRWTGIQIEEKHMRALHSAIMSGVRLVADRDMNRDQKINEVLAYVRKSVPDALKALLGGSTGATVLTRLVESKLQEYLDSKMK